MNLARGVWTRAPRWARAAAAGWAKRLIDPGTANAHVAMALLAFALISTLAATISKSGISIQGDMTDAYNLSRDFTIGYLKHPPMLNWIVAAWFAIMPVTDWSFYLLAYLSAALAMWLTWLAAGHVTDNRRRAFAVVLLGFTPIFTFHAATYNHNIVQLPFWPLVVLAFFVSIERRHLIWSVLLGLACAAAILSKYYAGLIVIACIAASFLHPDRAAYWRSPRPYVAAVVCVLALAPHLYWIKTVNFVSLTNPVDMSKLASWKAVGGHSVRYFGAYLAYLAPALLVVLLFAAQPARTILASVVRDWPPPRRLVACIALVPVLLPMLLLPLLAIAARVPWMYPALFFAPLAIVMAPRLRIGLRTIAATLGCFALATVAVAAISPLLMLVLFFTAKAERIEPYPALARIATDTWRARTGRPLEHVAGGVALVSNVSFYSADHPSRLPRQDRPIVPANVAQEWQTLGVLGLCRQAEAECRAMFEQHTTAERVEVTLPTGILGLRRGSVTYMLYVIPGAAKSDAGSKPPQ